MAHVHANTHPHKGSGNIAERMQEQARSGTACCLLDVTWLPHSYTHRNCAYLHKVKPAEIERGWKVLSLTGELAVVDSF